MKIEYLQELENRPFAYSDGKYRAEIKPISLDEIFSLENIYNRGKLFPKALRELLFLAGSHCYVLDYGLNNSQQELQNETRKYMLEFNRKIERPFFVIDVYNAGEQCLLVYLDEGDDPEVQSAYFPDSNNLEWIDNLEKTLSTFLNSRINKVIQGYNPF
jgi:hypothetical protein